MACTGPEEMMKTHLPLLPLSHPQSLPGRYPSLFHPVLKASSGQTVSWRWRLRGGHIRGPRLPQAGPPCRMLRGPQVGKGGACRCALDPQSRVPALCVSSQTKWMLCKHSWRKFSLEHSQAPVPYWFCTSGWIRGLERGAQRLRVPAFNTIRAAEMAERAKATARKSDL